ncbi:Ebp2-domain-containing protein [Balamuthia mandrillaris]
MSDDEMNVVEGNAAAEDHPNGEHEGVLDFSTAYINNQAGLLSKLEDIVLGGGREIEWIERLDHTFEEEEAVPDVHDDLQREAAFYKQALEAVAQSCIRFEDLGIPHKRPDDYFAEMVKSDQHMKKVRAKLLSEKKNLEVAAEKRKQRELKKFGKQVQAEKQQERAKQKKQQLEAIKQWRKERKQGNNTEDFSVDLLSPEDEADNKGKKRKQSNDGGRKNTKRQKKNEKYGFGGQKRFSKSNSADSAASMSGYNKRNNTKTLPHVPGAKKKNVNKNRPGKRRRRMQQGK